MAEYISKDAAVKAIQYRVCQGQGNKEHICKRGSCAYCGIMEIITDISSIQAADVQPVKRGRWTAYNFDCRGYADCFKCSCCENYVHVYCWQKQCDYDFCPNCGTRMDGDTE